MIIRPYIVSNGFRPRIKYGVTFFRRNDGEMERQPAYRPMA